MATVVANPSFDAEKACEGLRKAMKGLGTDEKAVIAILTGCNSAQRGTLEKQFKTMYGKSLIEDLKSELGGQLENVIVALMESPAQYEAHCLHHAIAGVGTDENVIIEILTTRTNAEITAIKAAYQEKYKKDLESAISGDLSGSTKRLMISLCQANRNETTNVDAGTVATEVDEIIKAGKGKWGTDESTFNRILMRSNAAHLRAFSEKYREATNEDLIRRIEHEFSGSAEKAFKFLVEGLRNPPALFAERLFKSMDGVGTNDNDLQRLIITRCEKDMVQIKEEFFKKHNKTLAKMIASDCAGDYKKVLLALIGEH